MPKYDDLTEEDLRALYMYVRQQAREAARDHSVPHSITPEKRQSP